MALTEMLISIGKEAWHVRANPLPVSCSFLPGADKAVILPGWTSRKINAVIVVDSPDRFRIDTVLSLFEGLPLIIIDHHRTSDISSFHSWIDPQYSSAAEMICDLTTALAIPITQNMATCLYAGIASDTGFFHFPNTTPSTMTWAAELMKKGASSSEIYKKLTCTLTRAELACCSEMISKVKHHQHVASTVLTKELLRRHKTRSIPMQYVHDSLFNSAENSISITAQELEPSLTKIGLRSNDGTDVGSIAQKFSGGGHLSAAGCTIHKHYKQAIADIITELQP